MAYNLGSKFDERMNSSAKNVKSYLYNDHPLLDKKCDYAIIVEIEDDNKTARVDYIQRDGKEIASLVSHIIENSRSHVETTRTRGDLDLNAIELVDELREYLPEEFKKTWLLKNL